MELLNTSLPAFAVIAREDGEEMDAVLSPKPQRWAVVPQGPRAVLRQAMTLPQVPDIVLGLDLGFCAAGGQLNN